MDRLAATITSLGGAHPVLDELTGPALARPVSFKVTTRHGELQVLNRVVGVPPYAELRTERLLVEVSAGVAAPVCSLGHLRAMKRAAGRPRDLVDLQELDEVHG